jgi:flagellar M-ring protein FliF
VATLSEIVRKVSDPWVRRVVELRAANPGLFDLGAIAGGLLLVAAAWFAAFSSRGNAILAGNLSAADRMALLVRLRQQGVPYTVDQDAIEVPESRLDEARRLLSSGPGFAGGEASFAIFDRGSLGQSAFTEQVSYQRALQGELERTIMNIRGVENARVMLAFEAPSPFALGPQSSNRASVLLTPAAGAIIDEVTARAIAHLVAGSVQGLNADQVVVTTDEGAVLFPPQRGENGEAEQVLVLRHKLEHDLETKADNLLNGIVGSGRYRLAVSVDLNREQLRETLYDYGSGKNEALLSEEHTVEPAAGASEAAGIPGLTSNLPAPSPIATASASPAAPSPGATPRPAAIAPNAPAYSRKDIVNYKPSTREIQRISEPLSVRRLSLAAVVDGTYRNGAFEPLSEAKLRELRNLLVAVVGADLSRGDIVEVSSAALTHPYIPPPPGLHEQLQQFVSSPKEVMAAIAAAALVAVAAIWMLARKLRHMAARRRLKRTMRQADVERPSEAVSAPGQPEIDLRSRASQQAERFPEVGAAIVRRWIEEGAGSPPVSNEVHAA